MRKKVHVRSDTAKDRHLRFASESMRSPGGENAMGWLCFVRSWHLIGGHVGCLGLPAFCWQNLMQSKCDTEGPTSVRGF